MSAPPRDVLNSCERHASPSIQLTSARRLVLEWIPDTHKIAYFLTDLVMYSCMCSVAAIMLIIGCFGIWKCSARGPLLHVSHVGHNHILVFYCCHGL